MAGVQGQRKEEITHRRAAAQRRLLSSPLFGSVAPDRLEKPRCLRCWGVWSCFLVLDLASCPVGRLGGGAGVTAHCAAGPTSSLLFVLFGRGLQSSFVCS